MEQAQKLPVDEHAAIARFAVDCSTPFLQSTSSARQWDLDTRMDALHLMARQNEALRALVNVYERAMKELELVRSLHDHACKLRETETHRVRYLCTQILSTAEASPEDQLAALEALRTYAEVATP